MRNTFRELRGRIDGSSVIVALATVIFLLKLAGLTDAVDLYVYEAAPASQSLLLYIFTETAGLYGSLAIALVYLFLVFQRRGYLDKDEAARVLLPFVLLNLLVGVLKLAVGSPRPPGYAVDPGSPLMPTEAYGFPSGHAARAGFLAGLMRPGRKAVRAMAILYVVLISASRIALGAHWLSDVMAGSLIGYYFGLRSEAISRWFAGLYRRAKGATAR